MMKMKRWMIALVALLALAVVLIAPAAIAGTPSGAGPNDALMVTNQWQTIAPGASLWFYFDYTPMDYQTGKLEKVEIDLDTHHVGNVGLAVYTPAEAAQWVGDPSTKPIGIGAQPGSQTAERDHDLVWQGAFNVDGRYFAVVTNNNSAPVSFLLTITGNSVTLYPTPTPTAIPTPLFNTPAPATTVSGKFVFMDGSGGNIFTVNGDGTGLTKVSTGIDPAWSPDGTQIAFARWSKPAGLYVANADGTNERLVFDWSQVLSPAWSPDGTMIAFSRQYGGNLDTVTRKFVRCITINMPPPFTPMQKCYEVGGVFAPNPLWEIGVVDAATGKLTEPKSTTHAFSPSWNVDNTTIAYADAGFGVQVTDLNQDAPSPLYAQVPTVQSVSWSPDGSQIAFEIRQHDHWEIAVVNSDGTWARQVTTPNPLAWVAYNNVAPRWSPDGKQILFMSDRNGKWEFFVIHPDGTGLAQVLKGVTDSMAISYNFNNERVIDWTK